MLAPVPHEKKRHMAGKLSYLCYSAQQVLETSLISLVLYEVKDRRTFGID